MEGTAPGDEPGLHEHDPTVTFVPVAPDQHPAITPERAAHLPGVAGYALVVERGPRAGMTFLLEKEATTVGRHPEDDIFLDDVTVSRHHATFAVAQGVLTVEDHDSTNGTYVNGTRVERAPVQPGDEVIVGKYHLVVAYGEG